MVRKKTAKKSAAKKVAKATGRFVPVVRDSQKIASSVRISRTSDGRFVINGTSQEKLVGRYPDVKFRKSSIKPSHFSEADISEIVKSMKVA